jgi:hypothetical protein
VATTDVDGRFLEIVPPEVGEVLDWYAAGHARHAPAAELSEFAGRFLVAMLDDGAVFLANSAASPAQTLALVLVHHQGNGEDPGAWLNLGIALRRMALYRSQDAEPVNRRRLQLALEVFDHSLRLQPDNIGKNVRAWTGKAFTYTNSAHTTRRCLVVRAHWIRTARTRSSGFSTASPLKQLG